MTDTTSTDVYIAPLNPVMRWVLIGVGFACVGLGLIGTVVPGMPTTIFMIIAALCFGRTSERWYRWLMTRKFVGRHFHSLMQGRGLPARVKAFAIIACWTMLGMLMLFAVKSTGGRAAIVVTALIQAYVVLRVPTLHEDN